MNYEELKNKAEQGDAKAQFDLGDAYDYGDIPPEPGKTAMESALEWYEKSAEQGYRLAQYALGSCYFYNKIPVANRSIALQEAIKWCTKAGTDDKHGKGDSAAQWIVSLCYANGNQEENGKGKDINKSFYWLKKSAYHGTEPFATAQSHLAGEYCKVANALVAGESLYKGTLLEIPEFRAEYLEYDSEGSHTTAEKLTKLINEAYDLAVKAVENDKFANDKLRDVAKQTLDIIRERRKIIIEEIIPAQIEKPISDQSAQIEKPVPVKIEKPIPGMFKEPVPPTPPSVPRKFAIKKIIPFVGRILAVILLIVSISYMYISITNEGEMTGDFLFMFIFFTALISIPFLISFFAKGWWLKIIFFAVLLLIFWFFTSKLGSDIPENEMAIYWRVAFIAFFANLFALIFPRKRKE